jgi:DNA-binding beta-propeller fold protein YncE
MRKLIFILFLLWIFASPALAQVSLKIIAGATDTTLFLEPFGMCLDDAGNLYVADAGHNCIKKVTPVGEVTVYAGTGKRGYADGPALWAMFDSPSGLCFDKTGNLYVAGFGGQNIRKITPDGMVSTVAGTGEEGHSDGSANQALFSSPRGICVDSKGNLFVGDCWNHRIRKITPDGVVSTFAGGGLRGELVKNAWIDGKDTASRFDAPCGLSIDKNDNIYVADANNNCIRKITPEGMVTTLAGMVDVRAQKEGFYGVSTLSCPTELFVANDGCIFVSATYGEQICRIDPSGLMTFVAGNGKKGNKNTEPLFSELDWPRGICLRGDELIWIEFGNRIIRTMRVDVGNSR